MKARSVSLLLDRRSMKRFNAATIWSISRGTRASSGFRSEGSRRQLALHPHQRPECAMHAERHQCQQQPGQHADRQQCAVDHVLRDGFTRAPGLADLHLYLALRRGCGEAAADHHEAHGFTAVSCIEQLRLRTARRRQVAA